jgi:LuxR family transcriptional regulator, maltose regulon positive regulatory protein
MLYNRFMVTPILATKLYIPPPLPKMVARSRLIQQLTEALSAGHKLTLISAPAGFGKSTLVSEWIVQATNCLAIVG